MILVSYSKTYILLCRYGYMPTGFDILEYDKSLQRYWLVRLVAAVIDSIIISLISFLVVIFFTRDVWINSFFFGIIWLLYSTVFEGIEGYTLGKKLMKLKVVTHVGNLDFQTSLVRNLSKIWGIFLIVDFIVGLATIGLYMVLTNKNLIKILMGLTLMEGAVNLFIITVGYVDGGTAPIFSDGLTSTGTFVDPITQALVLTAIVIGVSVLECIQSFEKVTNLKVPYKIVGRRSGDVEQIWANTTYANDELGWKAELGIDDCMLSAWNWEKNIRHIK